MKLNRKIAKWNFFDSKASRPHQSYPIPTDAFERGKFAGLRTDTAGTTKGKREINDERVKRKGLGRRGPQGRRIKRRKETGVGNCGDVGLK